MNLLPATTQAPTRIRYGVLLFVCSLSMITYLDRVCFAQVAKELTAVLGLHSEADLKLAFTAFALSYALFEIPTGWLGDVFGPRRTLIRIVLWWSVFTGLTGLVGLQFGTLALPLTAWFWILIAIRFLFGMGEAGAYPNITRALHNWLPFHERGLGQGAVWMSGRLMGGLTPLIWGILIVYLGLNWRATFWLFCGLGVLWCFGFALWFRDRPAEKPEVNEAERQLIRAGRSDTDTGHAHVPWLKLASNRNLWALCLMYFCASYGWYFNITYLPRFMEQRYGFQPDDMLGRLYMGGPLWLGAVGCLTGGLLTDWLVRRTGNHKWGRRIFGVIGHGLCAICYFACLFTPADNPFPFFLAISLAAFWNDMTMGAAWAACQDIGKRYAAIAAGAMNTIGNLGAAVAGTVIGLTLDRYLHLYASSAGMEVGQLSAADKAIGLLPGYQVNFVSFAAVYGIAAALWLCIDSTKPIVADEE